MKRRTDLVWVTVFVLVGQALLPASAVVAAGGSTSTEHNRSALTLGLSELSVIDPLRSLAISDPDSFCPLMRCRTTVAWTGTT